MCELNGEFMSEKDVLGAFTLIKDVRILSQKEFEDVKRAIKAILEESNQLKVEIYHKTSMIDELTQNEEKIKIELAKEKEKNKEHKTRIRNLECKIIQQKEQISGLRSKYHVDVWLKDDYVSKDKIKDMLDRFNKAEYVYTQDFIEDLEQLSEEK